VRSEAVPLDIDRPTPPFWGTKILKDEIALEDLFWHMDLQALIAGQRQKSLRRLCLADFFRPLSESKFDVFPMQAVTMGEIASEQAQVLFKADNYANYLDFHGMAVQMAEGLAEWGHARIRKELGYGDLEPDNIRDMLAQRDRGSRYSFGYPACPNVADQLQQLKIMGTERMGMTMDESEQLYPEQSTTALIVYHPVAKYFSA
jgi:5-methyltetrahydrofolate--homocysteine methyltransferase